MDKKKWTWVLIAVVTGLWTYNIYNTVSTFNQETFVEDNTPYSSTNLILNFKKDTFNLQLPKRDPFLNQMATPNQLTMNAEMVLPKLKQEKAAPKEVIVKPNKEWPKIKYFGFVRNKSKQHPLCVLSINGKIHKVSIGEMINEISLINATKDSLELSYFNENKFFLK